MPDSPFPPTRPAAFTGLRQDAWGIGKGIATGMTARGIIQDNATIPRKCRIVWDDVILRHTTESD